MSAMWILVLLFVAFVTARLFRSTKMWWNLCFAILCGLLVGMIGKEVINSNKKEKVTSITELVNTFNNEQVAYMQSLTKTVTEGLVTSHSGVAGYYATYELLNVELTNIISTNGRDSPGIEDDS